MLELKAQSKTMSTREIAELVGKTHSNIKISAERLREKGTLALQESSFAHNGNNYTEYFLSKRDSLILVAQNCPEFTAAIVDRWQELEQKLQPLLPTNYIEALEALVVSEKEKEAAKHELQEAQPKLEVYETLAERENDINTTILAKQLGTSAIKLNKFMREKRIKFLNNDLPQSPYSEWFNVIPVVKNGHEGSQCLITPLGVIEITKRWNKYNEVSA